MNKSRLKSTSEQVIEVLSAAVEMRDPYTRGHSLEVTRWAVAIGERMGLSRQEIKDLRVAGILHDIGKIGIPDSVLNKPSLLTAAEMMMVTTHSAIASDLVSKIDALAHLAPVIRHHHERYDGTGYPDGLKGEAIPFAARILAVADGFEAMTAERPYRPSKSRGKVIEELKAGMGTQWDPTVVEVFLKVLEQERNLVKERASPPSSSNP